jgi:hypothetical protein
LPLDAPIFRNYNFLMAKKMGRPRKRKADARSVLLQIRLTAAEKAGFAGAARLTGERLSVWVRARLCRDAQDELERAGKKSPFSSP